jgi:nucleoside 2-deoxyribosyltransferase
MKIYIAAPYPLRNYARQVADMLVEHGFIVTARWMKDGDELSDEWARNDLDDVRSADLLLAINSEVWRNKGTGGRHIEFGYALALGKKIVVMGVRTNIFHYLSNVVVVESEIALVAMLNSLSD